jgi:ribosomal protein S4E
MATEKILVTNGDRCSVVAGVHKGKSGIVGDIKISKTGHTTITVKQDNGVRFKTLARNVEKSPMTAKSSRGLLLTFFC